MSLSINQVVNVQLMPKGVAAQRRDLSMIAIFTDEMGEAFTNANTRYVVVSSAEDVANLFGSDSKPHQAAVALFSSRPKPKQAVIARWAKTEQIIPAKANTLKGSTVSVDINLLKDISNGSFNLSIGGVTKSFTGLDLTEAVDMEDVAGKLTTALDTTGVTAAWDEVGKRFLITATVPGKDDTTKLGYATEADAGEYLGELLRLEDGQATLIVGHGGETIAKETPTKALTALNNVYQDFYGVYFADQITDGELDSIHSWVAASSIPRVAAYTAIRDAQLEFDSSNILKELHDKASGRLMVQYNATGDDYAALEMMGIALSTNWAAFNSAKTVKFKQEASVASDDRINLDAAAKCRRLGINFYTDYDGVPMLAEGVMLGGQFIDEVVGLDAFQNAAQVEAFNTLQGSATKIPQTDKGQAILIAALTTVGEQFRNNGFLAGGVWRGDDIGELAYGDRLEEGYYFYSQSYDVQPQTDREARKAQPIDVALKLAGAIHTLDIVIRFNR